MTTGGTMKAEPLTPSPNERETTASSPSLDHDSNAYTNSTPNPRLVIPISGGDDNLRDRDRPISGARRDRPDSGSRIRTAGGFREDPGTFKKEKLLGDMQKASPEGHGYLPAGMAHGGAGVGSLKGLEEGGEFHEDSDECRPISPRRRRVQANDAISQGSAVSDAINDAVKPIVSHALIISSVNAFIAFVGLALEASRPQAAQLLTENQTDANSAPTPAPTDNASSSASSTTSSTRMEEIYWGLMSCLRAFLHVTYLVMIFQVLMGRLHFKRLYTYVLYAWCAVLSICFIIIQTAASGDQKTPFNSEVAMQIADMIFFSFSCYVLSMSRAEARGADVAGQ